MGVIVLKTAAWLCFAVGLLFALIQLIYIPGDPQWISALLWIIIMWAAWYFLLRSALVQQSRAAEANQAIPFQPQQTRATRIVLGVTVALAAGYVIFMVIYFATRR